MKNLLNRFFYAFLFLLFLFPACKSAFEIMEATASVSPVVDAASDKKMEEMLSPYSQTMKQKMDEVIGVAEEDMETGIPQGTLGNFVSDLMLNYTREKVDSNVLIALVNNGGLRAPIRKGNITIGTIYELMPFDNELVILSLRGSTLDSLVAYITTVFLNQNNVKSVFPFSGLVINLNKMGTYSVSIDGEPLHPSKIYHLVTSDYLADGGDNLAILKNASSYKQTGVLLRDLLISRIREAKGSIMSEIDSRFIVEF